MTITSKILRALKEAPATSAELGAILFPRMKHRDAMRRCSGHCCNLRTKGILKVIGKVPREGQSGTKCMSNLFAIR